MDLTWTALTSATDFDFMLASPDEAEAATNVIEAIQVMVPIAVAKFNSLLTRRAINKRREELTPFIENALRSRRSYSGILVVACIITERAGEVEARRLSWMDTVGGIYTAPECALDRWNLSEAPPPASLVDYRYFWVTLAGSHPPSIGRTRRRH